MSIRRTKLIEEIFNTIALPRERQEIDSLYAKGQKGVATAKMLRRIHGYWMRNIAKREMRKITHENSNRFIKITMNGVSSWEALEG